MPSRPAATLSFRAWVNQGFEVALHGYYTGEQLATMTYEEQKDLLERAKKAVEGCRPCGNCSHPWASVCWSSGRDWLAYWSPLFCARAVRA